MKVYRSITVSNLLVPACFAALASMLMGSMAQAAINCVPPPSLSKPISFTNVCPGDRGGPHALNARGRDVYIQLPKNRVCKRSITVTNARNVRITGGHIVYNDSKQAVINVGITRGTTFIDGMLIDVNKKSADAIRVYRHKGRLVVQNTLIKGVSGTVKGVHGDITHAQGGGPLQELIFQNVTGFTGYQGLFTPYRPASGHGTHKLRLERVNVGYDRSIPKSSGARKPLMLLYLGSVSSPGNRTPDRGTSMNNVYVDVSYWKFPYQKSVYAEPRPGSGGCATFDGRQKISGRVCSGKPGGGDFVPAGTVGRSYNRSRFCR
ncbi:MAG: hypothetical protein JNM75_12165 [Rhodospirillales bacterium]|nr:hypothetical protein [Rhodospirillales bacterium]